MEAPTKQTKQTAVELLRCSVDLQEANYEEWSPVRVIAATRLGVDIGSPAWRLAQAACDRVGDGVERAHRFLEAAQRIEEGSFP